jgi:SAM-dependent methyltransferase
MDTLSLVGLGAKVTGVDFSDKAILQACLLSKKTKIKANFICSDIYQLPEVMNRKFDIVFTSYGVLCWLPDLNQWAEVISHFLKKGGTFYIVEFHPLLTIFDDSKEATELKVNQPYFHKAEPTLWESEGSYAAAGLKNIHYEWTHSMGDILNALIGAGLRIEFLHEFPICCYKALPFMVKDETGWWRIKGVDMPLTFSLKATKF